MQHQDQKTEGGGEQWEEPGGNRQHEPQAAETALKTPQHGLW